MAKIAVIGGSGLDNPQILKNSFEKKVKNRCGEPSSPLTCGTIEGVEAVILARHGKGHTIPPSKVNYQANLLALKEEGCTHILAATAVGSLREQIRPGFLAFPSQFIDFTRHRRGTFHEDDVVHAPMSEPFDKRLRDLLCDACVRLGFDHIRDVTVVTIEGPRFSTKAESRMFRAWGADLVNMSTCPEAALANELGIPYQTLAMSTDYDCWKDDEPPVTYDIVMERMRQNAEKVKQLILAVIPVI